MHHVILMYPTQISKKILCRFENLSNRHKLVVNVGVYLKCFYQECFLLILEFRLNVILKLFVRYNAAVVIILNDMVENIF